MHMIPRAQAQLILCNKISPQSLKTLSLAICEIHVWELSLPLCSRTSAGPTILYHCHLWVMDDRWGQYLEPLLHRHTPSILCSRSPMESSHCCPLGLWQYFQASTQICWLSLAGFLLQIFRFSPLGEGCAWQTHITTCSPTPACILGSCPTFLWVLSWKPGPLTPTPSLETVCPDPGISSYLGEEGKYRQGNRAERGQNVLWNMTASPGRHSLKLYKMWPWEVSNLGYVSVSQWWCISFQRQILNELCINED